MKRDYKLSSPSAADRMIMEQSLELLLIHASYDKGGPCFFFFFVVVFPLGAVTFSAKIMGM